MLDRACGADEELREHLEVRLQRHQGFDATAAAKQEVIADSATMDIVGEESIPESMRREFRNHAFPPGSKLGKYDVKSFLARGGMGEVYHGYDPLIDAMSPSKCCQRDYPRRLNRCSDS